MVRDPSRVVGLHFFNPVPVMELLEIVRGARTRDEVIDRADAFENEAILFTHTSARYGHAEALDILRRRLPPSLAGRVTLLPPPEHR